MSPVKRKAAAKAPAKVAAKPSAKSGAAAGVISLRALGRATLARQHLLARAALDPALAVEQLFGMQAQVARPPFIGLWSRLLHFERKDLLRAVHDRKLVRATWLRATLFLVPARDYQLLRPALQPMLSTGAALLGDRAAGIELPRLLARARSLLAGRPATFDQLREELAAAFPGWEARAMGYLTRLHLPLVQQPDAAEPWGWAQSAPFALAGEWLGEQGAPEPLEQEAAEEALVLRALAAFGPATVGDVQTLTALKGLRPVFERLRPRLLVLRDERKRELFDLPGAPRPGEETPAPVRFLPEYDNLVLAHDDRSRLIDDAHRPQLVTKNLIVRATVLVDGRVAGTWSYQRKKDLATLTIAPFAPIPKVYRRAVEEEGEALLGFLEPEARKRAISFV